MMDLRLIKLEMWIFSFPIIVERYSFITLSLSLPIHGYDIN